MLELVNPALPVVELAVFIDGFGSGSHHAIALLWGDVEPLVEQVLITPAEHLAPTQGAQHFLQQLT